MKYILTTFAFLLSFLASAQTFEWNKKGADAGAEKRAAQTAYDEAYSTVQTGLASQYVATDAGKATIYGERYSPALLTASHPSLPLGSLVKVTNLATNRSVTVRINDKEQDCLDCLITLSASAADQIGMNVKARVSVERTGFSNWNPRPGDQESAPQPATYGNVSSSSATKYNTDNAPISIKGETYGWDDAQPTVPSAGATVRPAIYREQPNAPAPTTYGSAQPSVLDKEVSPSASPQPQPVYVRDQPVVASAGNSSAVVQTPVPQAAPPAPTVPYFQDGRTLSAPANYPTPSSAVVRSSPNRATQPAAAANTQPSVATAAAAPVAQVGHVIQLAAYSNLDYAQNRVEQLRQLGISGVFYKAFTKADGSMLYRVYSGYYPTRAAAQKAEAYNRSTFQINGVVTELK